MPRVGQAWREKGTGMPGRVVVITGVTRSYVLARAQANPYRRTRISWRGLFARFEEVGSMCMEKPEYWPWWFAEDVPQHSKEPGGEVEG